MKTLFSKNEMIQRKGCYTKQQVIDLFFTDNQEVTIETILTASISIKDKIWFIYNSCDLDLKNKQKLSLILAWAVLPIYETKYPNNLEVRLCLEGIEKFNSGEIPRVDLQLLRRDADVASAYASASASASASAYASASAAAYAYTYASATAYTAASATASAYAYAAASAAASATAYTKDLTYTQKLQSILLDFIK